MPGKNELVFTPLTAGAPNLWFTSDTHYFHANVIRYSKRPFANAQEMNAAMIANWNAVVQPEDHVFHLGDFAMAGPKGSLEILRQLQGHKHLVFGNHDVKLRNAPDVLRQFATTHDTIQIKVLDPTANPRDQYQRITLCHFAYRTWHKAHYGAWNLHGHSHGSLIPLGKQLDVGVDSVGFTPIDYVAVREIMSKREFVAVDHHDGDRG
jgi:calcineurin-like phosphoesterase family protein